jgi:hypothetical protein
MTAATLAHYHGNRNKLKHNPLEPGFTVMRTLIYVAVAVLIVAWLLGWFTFHISNDAMHAIIIIAAILLIYNLVVNRRRWYRRRW